MSNLENDDLDNDELLDDSEAGDEIVNYDDDYEGLEQDLEDILRSDDDHNIEADARRQGWRPKHEFKGNPADWVDAKTFIDNGPSYEKREVQKLREMTQNMQQMIAELVEKQNASERNQKLHTIKQLEQTVSDAKVLKDLDTYEEASKRLNELKQELPPEKVSVADVYQTPAGKEFVSQNQWATKTDPESMFMRGEAQLRLKTQLASNPNMSFDDQCKFVHIAVRKLFPDYGWDDSKKIEVRKRMTTNKPSITSNSGGNDQQVNTTTYSKEERYILKWLEKNNPKMVAPYRKKIQDSSRGKR